MPKIMKSLNNISRAQSVYRTKRLIGLCASHHAFVLAICNNPARPQEELSSILCLNKSTIARVLSQLEEKGFVVRKANQKDKREILVFPTQKMLDILPEVKQISKEFNTLITEDISQSEMEVFYSVLSRIEQRAKETVANGE